MNAVCVSRFLDHGLQLEFLQLLGVKLSRSIEHHVAPAVILREGDAVAYAIQTGHDAHEAVETEGEASMGRCAILESVDEEAELGHCPFWSKAQNVEHLGLQLPVVDTQ